MTANGFERYLLLERSGNNKCNTSVFEMRLVAKKVHIRAGNKGHKLSKKIYKKQSISEAIALFSDKRTQKMRDGYKIIKETDKNNLNNINENAKQNYVPPLSGKSISNPNLKKNVPNKSFSFTFGQKQKQQNNQNKNSNSPNPQQKLAKIRQQLHNLNIVHSDADSNNSSKKSIPNKAAKAHKKKRKKKRRVKKAKHKIAKVPNGHINDEDDNDNDAEESDHSLSSNQENKSQTANGHSRDADHDTDSDEEDEEIDADAEESDIESDDEDDNDDEDDSKSDKSSSGNSSVASGRSSDDEYEMDYEAMGNVMQDALNKEIPKKLDWKPLKLWIRFNEYHDKNGEYAFAPQVKRIAGSCHELCVIYMRSSSIESQKGVIYKRLLKLARDPDEDNKGHFENERKVSQYLYRMASMVNNTFCSRTEVAVWPVESVYFEYEGKMKWATIQTPFLPKVETNNIFVKIEPNSGKPCVDDPIVGRYQHLFAAITRGLNLVRDWQGYGVSQETYLDVCKQSNVENEAIKQIKIRKNKKLQRQTQVFVIIDPVLTTYNAHFETNNPTDFGVKAIDEWKFNHDCVRCRCKYFNLLSTQITDKNDEGMLFGIADPNQLFFDKDKMDQNVYKNVMKCRYDLDIWCGDDAFDDMENEEENEENDDKATMIMIE